MLKHFQPAATAGVLVVGDVILDRYLSGETERISPEAPVPVVRVTGETERPGGAANVAVNVRSLGLPTGLLGITGDDAAARTLAGQLQDMGISAHLSRQAGFPTTMKTRILGRHQQLLRLDYEIDPGCVDPRELEQRFRDRLGEYRLVVVSDYAKGSLRGVERLIAAATEQGIPVLVDPKGADFQRYRGAALLTPNLKEFEAVAGPCRDIGELAEHGRALCRDLDIGALLVTRGGQGMSLIQADEEPLHLSVRAHEVFDVTGAGDTVIATVAASLVSGYPLSEAIAYANLAAGLVVEKLGTASVSVAELNRAVNGRGPGGNDKLLDPKGLEQVISTVRARGQRLVMTNGCFDILHAGHVAYLEQARALGDRLLVAVNDDASVTRLKGPGRPVIPLAERMAVLAGLSAVDWVVPFADETPEALVRQLSPACLVKGGDYREEQVAGAEFVRSRGGEVRILPLLEGLSSTGILAALRGGRADGES